MCVEHQSEDWVGRHEVPEKSAVHTVRGVREREGYLVPAGEIPDRPAGNDDFLLHGNFAERAERDVPPGVRPDGEPLGSETADLVGAQVRLPLPEICLHVNFQSEA